MKLLVFDADETLTTTASGKKFPESPTDKVLKFDPKILSNPNWYCMIASNQKGFHLGFKTKDFIEEEFNYLDEITHHVFNYFLVCPDDGTTVWIKKNQKKFISFGYKYDYTQFVDMNFLTECKSLIGTFRKPMPGMLYLAEKIARSIINQDEKITDKIFVGDMETDALAAQQAGFKFFYINEWLAINN